MNVEICDHAELWDPYVACVAATFNYRGAGGEGTEW